VLDYFTWRQLVRAFVCVEARRFGWVACSMREASTGTWYLLLRRGEQRVTVRISDHRSSALARSPRIFSIRWSAPRRVRDLPQFLRDGYRLLRPLSPSGG